MTTTRESTRSSRTLSTHLDTLLLFGLFLGTVLSRIPFRSQILYHWDSVNFANAMRHFDMLQEHPQPPGYIVYVWLCRLVDLAFHEANTTMVWASIVASGMAVVMVYLLGKMMWDRRVGAMAALFLASSPLFWFYGEIALPHTVDAFLVLLAVWLLYRIRQGERRILWLAIVVLAITGGVRQQTLIFLLPLVFYAMWGLDWRHWLMAGGLGGVLCLLWFVPLMASCGGISAYLSKTSTFTARFQESTSIAMGAGWSGIVHNLRKLGLYTAYGLGTALVAFGLGGLWRLVRADWPRRAENLIFLGVWVAPGLLFYSLVHMGQQGLIFVYLPALILLAAVVLMRLVSHPHWTTRILLVMLLFINASAFLFANEYPLGPGTQRLLTRSTLANSDQYFQSRFVALREQFPPQRTAIVASKWAYAEYYLPEYTLLRVDQVAEEGATRTIFRQWPGSSGHLVAKDLLPNSLPAEGGSLVLFDPELQPLVSEETDMGVAHLANGDRLLYLLLKPGWVLLYDDQHGLRIGQGADQGNGLVGPQ